MLNFGITRELISDVTNSYSKYEADRIVRKTAEEAEKARKRQVQEAGKAVLVAKELSSINTEIESCKASLKVANNIDDAKTKI